MDVDHGELTSLVAALRDEGSDSATVEAKSARHGFPTDLAKTISAFANTPGGGVVLLGLDERRGFASVPVYDVGDAQARVATIARRDVVPPVMVDVGLRQVDGRSLVVAEVQESPAASKPVRVRRSQKAYLRAYDGDFEMSALEEQALIANRDHPRSDRQPVAGTSVDDLDADLLSAYRRTCRTSSSALSRFDDDELLLRTGVVLPDGRLTLAGLLSLGVYPQQFVPNLVIQASVAPRAGDPEGTRASDMRKFDGPLPLMLDEATQWVQRNTRTRLRFGDDGHGRDEPEYPLTAVRELIANAVIHRDLGPHAMSYPVSLVLEQTQLVIANPGGLWGITVDRLGHDRISSARNDSLVRIAQNVRLADGRRVVEALASGIPDVLASLRAAGMVPPVFHDLGVRFTVRMPNHALLAPADLQWLAAIDLPLNDAQRHALVAMRHGQVWTNSSFRAAFPRDSTAARADLQGLVDARLATAHGERGGRTYSLAPEVAAGRLPEPFDLFAAINTLPRLAPEEGRISRREENARTLLAVLGDGPRSAAELSAVTGMTRRRVEYALDLLRGDGRVRLEGRRGVRGSVYIANSVVSRSEDG